MKYAFGSIKEYDTMQTQKLLELHLSSEIHEQQQSYIQSQSIQYVMACCRK